ncbi:alginate lyase family protein [Erythrobacter crassostreae]|uniref:Alginate lyase family protein n=1 Tax=Erythrobacter crassostreae TaxID=2828328 RepID=A0A9X1F5C4_9SPHN|nr:alginate lyase family protein [Erythrobacter crassostrea]MBV7259798.1 alginate lyase family protein [Erythrobacter crassostrea]
MVKAFLRKLSIICIAVGLTVSAQTAYAQEAQTSPPVCRGSAGYAADFDGRRTFLWRPAWLAQIKTSASTDEAVASKIRRDADRALTNARYSVTDKPKLPPGATANDYASIGPYWWPDPKKRDGLPYIRKDGQVNPEREGPEFDKDRLRSFSNDVRDLALAYYVTEDERYARHAAQLLRAWFITPETRMNPHFDFAQGIPGKVKGRGEGVIEASHLSTTIEAIGLLGPSDALSADERRALQEWYRDFVVWMATSENGEAEMKKTNNHGLYYDFYLAHFALFAGADSAARNVTTAFPEYRLARQMDRRGRFIAELKRTRSWHYSIYTVEAAARLATIAECVDVDLWNAQLYDGRGLSTAREFLAGYSHDLANWPFQDRDLERGRIDKMKTRFDELMMLFPDSKQELTPASLP